MTAEEIRESSEQYKTSNGWLREIAYQLALLNERPIVTPLSLPPVPEVPKLKRK